MEKEQIHKAFMRLGEILRDRRVTGEVDVFGGAAIVLGFDFRRATQDVGSLLISGHGQVMQAAQDAGKELRLPPNWLNEQATIYLSKHRGLSLFRMYPSEGQFGFRVLLAKPEYVLAMKLLCASSLRTRKETPCALKVLKRLLNVSGWRVKKNGLRLIAIAEFLDEFYLHYGHTEQLQTMIDAHRQSRADSLLMPMLAQ